MSTLTPPPAPPALRRFGRAIVDGLTYPHGVDGFRDAYQPAAAGGRIPATVVAVTPRTPRAHSLLLRPHQPLAFAPGQHVLVTTQVRGARQTRCYSLSDTPLRTDGLLEITVAHIPAGLVSSHLVGGIAVGETVGLSAPQGGDFVLPLPRPSQLLLIGGGSGITPLRSMWRTMAAEGMADRVTVLYYARSHADVIFADELTQMAGAHVVTTREPCEGPLAGRFQPGHLATLGLQPATLDTFACGPSGLVHAVAEAFDAVGAAGHLRTESFAPPAAPVADGAVEGLLTFARSGTSAHNDGTTLLAQAEAAGLSPEAGCRMGICHSCITTKHAGTVRDIRSGQTDDREDCEVQLCISQPVGNVALDL